LAKDNRYFSSPPAFDAALEGFLSEYCRTVWKNWNSVAPQWWKKFNDTFCHFGRIPTCDGQTDGRTDILWQHSSHYAWHLMVKMWT